MSAYRFALSKTIGVGLSLVGGAVLLLLLSCSHDQPDKQSATYINTTMVAVDLNSGQEPVAIDGPLKISAAKNEWVSFTVEIKYPPDATKPENSQILLFSPIKSTTTAAMISPDHLSVYQVLEMPVDCRGADFVRQTGMVTATRQLPRALLPLAMNKNTIDLAKLHGQPVVLWIDLHVPAELVPGDYAGSCDLMGFTFPFSLHVYDFTIPEDRHLKLVSQIPWDQLARLYPDKFEAITPRLVNRDDPKYAGAVKIMDDLVALAQRNRVEAVIPRLQPTVKWPTDQPPDFDWSDFDSMVASWLNGDKFADKTPLGYWPLPTVDYLDNYNATSRQQYWSAVTAHFSQKDWLNRTTSATTRPSPYSGGSDETNVRLCAWQTMLKPSDLILFDSSLPNQQDPTQPATPGELIWFYPGSWFGREQPIPSIQLKWLRRAQQDYEYFYLASQHHMALSARQIARGMANTVELQPGQEADPIYDLFGGDIDSHAWAQARELLARAVLVHPGDTTFNLDLLRWLELRENHLILPRVTQWSWDAAAPPGQNWANLKLGVDVYNGGDARHDAEIRWQSTVPAWQFSPAPISIGELPAYAAQRTTMQARINLDKLSAETRNPVHLLYVDAYNQKEYPATACLPVAASDRREAGLKLSDDLSTWTSDDLLHDGKLIKFYTRPAIQRHQIDLADAPSQVYSAWSDDNFYLAFKLNGISTGNTHHTNIPEYQLGRAWGEDLCEVLVQAVYDDNSAGPVLHVVCKPTGALWIESKKESRPGLQWESLEGAPIRYAANAEKNTWTGELAIAWKSLAAASHAPTAKPKLLRFNFSQHCLATGQSTSWAGPVDSGRDDTCTGLIFLRDIAAPGMHEKPEAR